MTSSIFAKRRCRNHEERQAACRCPGCALDFCRECVTEHHERFLCSRCLAQQIESGRFQSSRSPFRNVVQGLAGILAAFLFFFLAGELTTMVVAPSHEVHAWHER